jgi:hypothetical protein
MKRWMMLVAWLFLACNETESDPIGVGGGGLGGEGGCDAGEGGDGVVCEANEVPCNICGKRRCCQP